jgi:hypothetical protein
MTLFQVHSFAEGHWVPPGGGARKIADAITGEVFAEAGNAALDLGAMRDYAKARGGPALRAMDVSRPRADAEGAGHSSERRAQAAALSNCRSDTGATRERPVGSTSMAASERCSSSPPRAGARCPTTAVSISMEPGGAAVAQRQFLGPPYLHAAPRRGGAHQRLQFPRLGYAGKAGADASRRCARHRETRHRESLLRHRGLRCGSCIESGICCRRWSAATGLGRAWRHFSTGSTSSGRGQLHRLRRHGAEVAL